MQNAILLFLTVGFWPTSTLRTGETGVPPLPPGVELVNPKDLGLSDAEIEAFLGNVNVLSDGKDGVKSQIMTVGFDQNDKISFQDFHPLSSKGLSGQDKIVTEMAIKGIEKKFASKGKSQSPQTNVFDAQPPRPPSPPIPIRPTLKNGVFQTEPQQLLDSINQQLHHEIMETMQQYHHQHPQHKPQPSEPIEALPSPNSPRQAANQTPNPISQNQQLPEQPLPESPHGSTPHPLQFPHQIVVSSRDIPQQQFYTQQILLSTQESPFGQPIFINPQQHQIQGDVLQQGPIILNQQDQHHTPNLTFPPHPTHPQHNHQEHQFIQGSSHLLQQHPQHQFLIQQTAHQSQPLIYDKQPQQHFGFPPSQQQPSSQFVQPQPQPGLQLQYFQTQPPTQLQIQHHLQEQPQLQIQPHPQEQPQLLIQHRPQEQPQLQIQHYPQEQPQLQIQHHPHEQPQLQLYHPHEQPQLQIQHHPHEQPQLQLHHPHEQPQLQIQHHPHEQPQLQLHHPHEQPQLQIQHHPQEQPQIQIHHPHEQPQLQIQHHPQEQPQLQIQHRPQEQPQLQIQHHPQEQPQLQIQHHLQEQPQLQIQHHPQHFQPQLPRKFGFEAQLPQQQIDEAQPPTQQPFQRQTYSPIIFPDQHTQPLFQGQPPLQHFLQHQHLSQLRSPYPHTYSSQAPPPPQPHYSQGTSQESLNHHHRPTALPFTTQQTYALPQKTFVYPSKGKGSRHSWSNADALPFPPLDVVHKGRPYEPVLPPDERENSINYHPQAYVKYHHRDHGMAHLPPPPPHSPPFTRDGPQPLTPPTPPSFFQSEHVRAHQLKQHSHPEPAYASPSHRTQPNAIQTVTAEYNFYKARVPESGERERTRWLDSPSPRPPLSPQLHFSSTPNPFTTHRPHFDVTPSTPMIRISDPANAMPDAVSTRLRSTPLRSLLEEMRSPPQTKTAQGTHYNKNLDSNFRNDYLITHAMHKLGRV